MKSGSDVKPRRKVGTRLLVAATLAWAATWGAVDTASAQDADPAQAEAPPAAPAEETPAPTEEAPEAGQPGALPTPLETQADEKAETPPQPEVEAETPSSAAGADTQAPGEPEAEPGETEAKPGRWIRGSFEAGFDGNWSDEGSDIDLDQTIRLRLDPPQYPRIHVRGGLSLQEDLDSDDDYYEPATRDFDDTYDSDVHALLTHLYVDIDDLWGDSVLRLGRQRIEESPLYNRVDGLYFKQRLQGWEWYAFGGARASNYYDTFDDGVVGGGLAFQLASSTRLALDAFYGEEDRDDDIYVYPVYELFGLEFPRRVEDHVDDNYVSLSLWQWFAPNISLFGRVGVQNGDLDDVVLTANGQYPKWDLSYEVTYRGQMDENGDQVNDLTSYYRILGEYEEFDDLLIALHRPLSEVFTLSLEGQFHSSDAGGDETWANRDFERYALILSADELFPTVDASASLEYWDVTEDEGTWTLTGEVSKTWERLELVLGADYERYEDRIVEYNEWVWAANQFALAFFPPLSRRFSPVVFLFDTYAVETHENIYSVYGDLTYSLADDQEVGLRISYEEDDGPDSPYWRVQAGYTINF